MDTIFRSTLELMEDDIETHRLVICAGDQLSLSLLDKVHTIPIFFNEVCRMLIYIPDFRYSTR